MRTTITLNATVPIIEEAITGDASFSVTLRDQVVITAGEYADLGQPDVLVLVLHAVDDDGTDIRPEVARALSSSFNEAQAAKPSTGAAS